MNTFAGFEPAATGFYDNVIRGSVLLGLGKSVGSWVRFLPNNQT
ncbi:MAG: hypothetical protein R3B47_14335 [Bacteroidia bacterium]